jgi:S-(hydroxymethyl)glutathione dehydrogenase/alcohol dehydrogenase
VVTTRAAVLHGINQDFVIETVEVDDPSPEEVLVQMRACGLCHSDEHARTGDLPMPHFPIICGHEGAGEVVEVGPGVTSVRVGDHVALSFMPSCGECQWCLSNRAHLCDAGAKLFTVGMMTDGRIAHRIGDLPVARYSQLGAFSEVQLLPETSVVKVDPDIPWSAVALVSCGVATGFGSAVNRGGVKVGDTVAVLGVGGVGINAVQGARIAGARRVIAVDRVPYKLEQAQLYGATHTYRSLEEAQSGVADLTEGAMCDVVVCTFGVMYGDLLQPAMNLTAKGGTCVVTSVAPVSQSNVDLSLMMLSMMDKKLVGSLYGSESPRVQIPRLLGLYRDGILKIDELITKTYSLDEVNKGYADLADGTILRGALSFD